MDTTSSVLLVLSTELSSDADFLPGEMPLSANPSVLADGGRKTVNTELRKVAVVIPGRGEDKAAGRAVSEKDREYTEKCLALSGAALSNALSETMQVCARVGCMLLLSAHTKTLQKADLLSFCRGLGIPFEASSNKWTLRSLLYEALNSEDRYPNARELMECKKTFENLRKPTTSAIVFVVR